MSRRLPALKPRQVLKALQKAGFFIHHATGSHYILKHANIPEARVTLPFHRKDLKRRTLETIIKQSGITLDRFLSFL